MFSTFIASCNPFSSTKRSTTVIPTPSIITSATHWLDATDASKVNVTGTNVNYWLDSITGTVRYAAQGGDALHYAVYGGFGMRYKNYNLVDSSSWNGSSSSLRADCSQLNTLYSITIAMMVVPKRFDLNVASASFSSTNFVSTPGWVGGSFGARSTSANNQVRVTANGTLNQTYTGFTPVNNQPICIIYTCSGSNGGSTNITCRINGSVIGSPITFSPSTPFLTDKWDILGKGTPGANTSLNGGIGTFLYYNTALSTSDTQAVEGYICWKWGFQASLPAGHPYVSAPPS